MCLFVTDVRYGSKEILPIVAILSSPGNPKWPFQIVYLVVRFTRAKYDTSSGLLCRATQACIICQSQPSVHLVTTTYSPNFDQMFFMLGTCTAQCMYTIVSIFHRTKIVIWGQFSATSPPYFFFLRFCPPHVATLRAYVIPKILTGIPKPLDITKIWHWQLND